MARAAEEEGEGGGIDRPRRGRRDDLGDEEQMGD
jgi:hypothetical protein